MKIAFTSMNEKNALSVCDLNTGDVTHISNRTIVEDHRPFGITWQDDKLYIAQPTSIVLLNKRLEHPVITLHGLWYGIHQILARDGKLWMISPRLNAIEICDLKTRDFSYFTLEDHKLRKLIPAECYLQDRLKFSNDISHYNSIFIKDDRLYVSAHNHAKPSFISEYSYPDLKFIKRHEKLGKQIHNIYVENDEIFTLDSLGSQSIVSTKGECIKIGTKGQFVRGLAVTKELFIVACFPYDPKRHTRRQGESFIVVVDRKKKEVVKKLRVKDIGNINDIRILDEPDLAHGNAPFWSKDFKF